MDVWIVLLFTLLSSFFGLLTSQYTRGATCSFPEFVWLLPPDTKERVWFTKTKYLSNGFLWESRRKILAKEGVLAVHTQYQWTCPENPERKEKCIKSEVIYTIACMRSEGEHVYRVAKTGQGIRRYMCIRFVKRNKNILQLWISKPSNTNKAELCYEEGLQRDDWPWIAAEQVEWSVCPFAGGYDFVAYVNGRKRAVCHRVWRPSRLESECIMGEGLRFTFPEKTCSFFYDRVLRYDMVCWGWWIERSYVFIVAGEAGKQPQFVLRFTNTPHTDHLTSELLFSPVCPDNVNVTTPSHVIHVQLKLRRSESGICYDESDKCPQIAQTGKCSNGNLHQYGNHCKRSCGLCELVPSDRPECEFPLAYRGQWLAFERGLKYHVTITSGRIQFSKFGNFMCKAKHWERNMYKFLSVYQNGCRPRYTCMEFKMNVEKSYLSYRLSSSSNVDKSFTLCQFTTGLEPMQDRDEESNMKILFPVSSSYEDSCRLGGLVTLEATFSDRRTCQGSLSDWNPFTCSFSAKLALSLRQCRDGLPRSPREFRCEAYITLSNNKRLLFTREEPPDNRDISYQCWVINTSNSSTSRRGSHWMEASVLERKYCERATSLKSISSQSSELSFRIETEPSERHCIVINSGSSPRLSSVRLSLRKSPKDLRSSRGQLRVGFVSQSEAVTHDAVTKATLFIFITYLFFNSFFV